MYVMVFLAKNKKKYVPFIFMDPGKKEQLGSSQSDFSESQPCGRGQAWSTLSLSSPQQPHYPEPQAGLGGAEPLNP